jgi:flagellar protein FliO/FliZ
LLFVIAVIYLFAWYLRRHQSSGVLNQKMTVIAALSVGARERVVLVQLAEKQILLGVSPGRVNLLQAYDQPILDNHHAAQQSPFAKLLAGHLKSSSNNEVDSDRS